MRTSSRSGRSWAAGPRGGRAAIVVTVLLALAALLVVALGPGGGGGRDGPPDGAARGPVPSPTDSTPADRERPEPAPPAHGERSAPPARLVAADEPTARAGAEDRDLALAARASTPEELERFRGGSGTLRGHVAVEGASLPAEWRLVLEPSTSLVGRELAERREVELLGPEFEVAGLPLAGYDVRAVADGMNGPHQPVLLDRRNPNPYVVLSLSPAGFVQGTVVDHERVPVDGLAVALVPREGGETLVSETDRIGRFHFGGVLDGAYTLAFGDPASPILPAETLRVRAPSLSLPPRVLPPLGSLVVEVADERGVPLAGVEVVGSCSNGGVLRAETDAYGRAEARHLQPGRYRLSVRHEEHGRTRQTAVVEAGAEPARLAVRLDG